jgi:hypothetical protein
MALRRSPLQATFLQLVELAVLAVLAPMTSMRVLVEVPAGRELPVLSPDRFNSSGRQV